jgi:integrase/recombinase XerD
MRHIHKASLYVRQRNTRGKYAFICVEGQGRKPTSGRFYVRHTNEQGKQKWVPLSEDLDYKKAVQERDAFAAGLHATRHGLTVAEMEEHVGRVGVKDAVAAFLNDKAHKTPRTLQAYRHTLGCFAESLPGRIRFIDEVDAAALKHFQDGMAKQGLAPKTIRNRMLIASFLLKHAAVAVKVNWQNAPIVEKQPVRAFSDAELRRLFDACNPEEHAVFSFFLGTGCREQEVSHAEWSDVDWQHHTFTVQAKPEWGFTPKSHEARQIPVPGELLITLKSSLRSARAGQQLIFPNQDGRPNGHLLRMLKRLALRASLNCGQCVGQTHKLTHKDKNARLEKHLARVKDRAPIGADAPHAEIESLMAAPKKLTCKTSPVCEQWYLHRFRKTFATKLHHGGTRLKDLQQWLGHKSLSTTEHYLAGSDLKAAHVRAQVDKAFSF